MARQDRFTNKTAIVTGSGRGIGEAAAEGFAREGANVVIAELDKDLGEAVAERLKGEGLSARWVQVDVTQPDSIRRLIAESRELFGRIDILVNNAGGGSVKHDGIRMALDDWNFVLNFNLTSAWYAMTEVLDPMIEQGGGAIVNVSSMGALRHTPHHNIAYACAKAAMVRLTEIAALRYAEHNIRVNVVAPGLTLTPNVRDVLAPEQIKAAVSAESALPRLGEPIDQAAGILYLASEEASYVTGQTLCVDGGWYVK